MLQLRTILLTFIWLVAMVASQTSTPVFAEQSPTVKQCLEHPETCEKSTAVNQKGTTDQQPAQAVSSFTAWDVVKLIFATLFVLALIYALLRFMNQRGRFLSKRGLVEHLGGAHVGTNRSVQLVKVGKRIFVVGVGDSVHLLREIDDEEEIKELLAMHNESLQKMLEPNELLTSWLHRLMKKETKQETTSFRDLFAQQMQELTKERQKLLKQIEKGTTSDE
ncbi:flagella biosynthesis regulatory protein FliZ [Anoxybacillus sp. J5B_2022]|uniref:flagella biosynthesis regulatory protein FliZ n=1 Tax=Anoxybacillus sp. J5B_2022 TaxID=3003246 RepID=UPI0022858E81|nr:flagella biosynthesis regulatory protein FliZ [Anoxybacillus sp. J5B_2022]MCZ0755298.1 flagella biosynthesis regulatory protein FliZ [Anoxybacillus sp. J5B_2022]